MGKARHWAIVDWYQRGEPLMSFNHFVEIFHRVFDHFPQRERIWSTTPHCNPREKKFGWIRLGSGSNELAHKAAFCQGLNQKVWLPETIKCPLTPWLIWLSAWITSSEIQVHKCATSPTPEPDLSDTMQSDQTKHRRNGKIYFLLQHSALLWEDNSSQIKPRWGNLHIHPFLHAESVSVFLSPVHYPKSADRVMDIFVFPALIDSGAAGNFTDHDMVIKLNTPMQPL